MGATEAQHVDVELVRLGHHDVHLEGRDHGEALEEADAQRAVGDDLRERQRRGVGVEAALDDLEVGRDRAQVLVRRLVRQVPQAQRLPDLAGRQELLELCALALVRRSERRGRRRRTRDGGCVLTRAGMSMARSGMCRSPITRTSREVMVVGVGSWRWESSQVSGLGWEK